MAMTVPARLLLADDEETFRNSVAVLLRREGYVCDVASNVDEAIERLNANPYDLLITDLRMPGNMDLELLKAASAGNGSLPVIVVTAFPSVPTAIEAVRCAVVDYLVKPFDFGELLARLRVLIGRGPVVRTSVLEVGNIRVDCSTRIVTRSGRQVELTAREFDVLAVLARSPGRLVSRAQLLMEVWHEESLASANITDVYIGQLRKKLERPKSRRLIRTVRGKGFVLEVT